MSIDLDRIVVVVSPAPDDDGRLRGMAHAAIVDAGVTAQSLGISTTDVLDYFFMLTGLTARVDGPLTNDEEVQYMAEAVAGLIEERGSAAYYQAMEDDAWDDDVTHTEQWERI